MRPLICVAVLLLALWSCSACAAFKHRCVYDKMQEGRTKSPRVARLLPTSTNELVTYAMENEFSPIRITVTNDEIFNQRKHCTREGNVVPDFRGGSVQCGRHDVLTTEKAKLLLHEIVPEAVKLHQDRLLVQRQTGPLRIPDDEFKGLTCEHFTILDYHKKNGYPSTDTVMYLGAVPNKFGAAAWADVCVTSPEDQRPLFGAMVVGPAAIATNMYITRFVAHEISHVLGFDLSVFQNKKAFDRLHIPCRNVTAGFVIGSTMPEAIRMHFDCFSPFGLELHQDTPTASMESHWSRRNAKDELMSPIVGIGRYTVLTMAAFEALGYYRTNWTNREYMKWGRGNGCDFLNEKCIKNGETRYKDHFCTDRPSGAKSSLHCASDRTAMGFCTLLTHSKDLLPQFQYFEHPRVGGAGEDVMEHCPIYESDQRTSCLDGNDDVITWSVFGPDSRCFDGDDLTYENEAISSLCVDVKCSEDSYEIRHKNAHAFVKCVPGSSIEPGRDAGFGQGKILCPPYREVCEVKWPFRS